MHKSELTDPSPLSSRFAWPSGKLAAVSFTFDDSRGSQLDHGIPILDRHHLSATFYVLPKTLEPRRSDWLAAQHRGHEMGCHTLRHPCSGCFEWSRAQALEDYTLESMAEELDLAREYLDGVFGESPQSFAYPCYQSWVGRGQSRASYVPLVASRFTSGRSGRSEAPNPPDYCDLSCLNAFDADGRSFEELKGECIGALAQGHWLILSAHEILPQPCHLTLQCGVLDQFCEWLTAQTSIWVAPVGTIADWVKRSRTEPI
jgi:peptidoglycan-N-acetylglucosamine deacetylase